MKTKATVKSAACLFAFAIFIFTSCQKSDVSNSTGDASASPAIAVLASASTAVSDSVYIMQACSKGARRDSIGETDLPASVSTYLSSNYAGHTFNKAFVIHNRAGATTGYIAVIYYNDKPVGLEFDSNGNFVKVLEQREKGDLEGRGVAPWGPFP
jgi:uncharacterized protein YfiM (DUF2279 family)